jgi:hypothetical protein
MLVEIPLWQGKSKIMRTMNVALALGAALALCGAAHAEVRKALVRVPVVKADPYWVPDYNIVPRYRYNPRDDRVDTSPYAKPVVTDTDQLGGTGGSEGFGW